MTKGRLRSRFIIFCHVRSLLTTWFPPDIRFAPLSFSLCSCCAHMLCHQGPLPPVCCKCVWPSWWAQPLRWQCFCWIVMLNVGYPLVFYNIKLTFIIVNFFNKSQWNRRNFDYLMLNKMLSYRRETTLQGAL